MKCSYPHYMKTKFRDIVAIAYAEPPDNLLDCIVIVQTGKAMSAERIDIL